VNVHEVLKERTDGKMSEGKFQVGKGQGGGCRGMRKPEKEKALRKRGKSTESVLTVEGLPAGSRPCNQGKIQIRIANPNNNKKGGKKKSQRKKKKRRWERKKAHPGGDCNCTPARKASRRRERLKDVKG